MTVRESHLSPMRPLGSLAGERKIEPELPVPSVLGDAAQEASSRLLDLAGLQLGLA